VDIERAVISKILSTGNVEEALAKGIRSDHFADEECQEMYEWITSHVRRYTLVPSEEALEAEKPKWEHHHVKDSLSYLLDHFIGVVKRRLAQEMVVELAAAADDPERAQTIDLDFLEVSRKLATIVPSSQVARFSDMDKRIVEYEQMKEEGGRPGVPFGFPTLDEYTGGLQPHEFMTVSGFSGLGKSTLLMVFTHNMVAKGIRPLYISLEMEARAILRRLDAMAAGIDYTKLKQLELEPEAVEDWRKVASEIREAMHEVQVIDNIRGCTPDHIFAETVRHKPDVVMVDYVSLMRSGRPTHRGTSMWQSLTEITQDLKQNARTLGIPIIAAAQTNRSSGKDGAELDNIGYSISVVQDSDIVLGLYSDEEMREKRLMEIRINKNRDGKIGKFSSLWDYENGDFREANPTERLKRTRLARQGGPRQRPARKK
jgi:replicative DNA helicase